MEEEPIIEPRDIPIEEEIPELEGLQLQEAEVQQVSNVAQPQQVNLEVQVQNVRSRLSNLNPFSRRNRNGGGGFGGGQGGGGGFGGGSFGGGGASSSW